MHRVITHAALGFCLVTGLTVPAFAQDAPPPGPPPSTPPPSVAVRAPRKPAVFRAYGSFDRMTMTASQSFDAMFGSSSLTGFGAGVEALDLWKGVFGRVTFGFHGSGEGSRVVVSSDGQVIDMGIPFEVSLNDFSFGGGWRQTVSPRLVAYGGAGFTRASYSEKSDGVKGDGESFVGQNIFGGVEFALSGWLIVGGEVEWRTLPDALGQFPDTVSQAFNETNLGGTALRVLFGIRK